MELWQENIQAYLRQYSGFDLEIDQFSFCVRCKNPESFDVTMIENGSTFQVCFDGWHEVFDAKEEALSCFKFGLSQNCRLKVDLHGTYEHRWCVEYLQDGYWITDTQIGLLFFPIWRKQQTVYRWNRLT